MKSFSITFVVLAIMFFAVAGFLAWQGTMSVENYAIFGGIIGSVASIIGLLAFASPGLTSRDILRIEGELLEKLGAAAKSVEEYESRISDNRERIEQLEKSRREIELIVRQASLKIFLEEKMLRLSEEIESAVTADSTLTALLTDYGAVKRKIKEIDGTISASAHADLINEIVGSMECIGRSEAILRIAGVEINMTPFLQIADKITYTLTRHLLP